MRRQRAEIESFFAESPESAQIPHTTLAIGLINQAVEHYKNNDFELAKQALQDAIQYDPQSSYAYELMGDIEYRGQNLSEAREHYSKAYVLEPRTSLKEKIEKARKEASVERGLSTYREKHFIIKYHDSNKTVQGFELRELLRTTYENLSKSFGYYFKHQVVVLLYSEEQFKQLTNLPHWVGGLYDGKVRMPINSRGFSNKDLAALTAHEVTHAFVAAMSGGAAPPWINEGLARYHENKVKPQSDGVLKSALKYDQAIPIDQLMIQGELLSIKDGLMIMLFYEQSQSLVSYMVKRYGMFRIKQILGEYAKGKNSDEALQAVIRISPQRLEREWKDSL